MSNPKKKKWSAGQKMLLLAGVLVLLLLGNFALSKINAKAGKTEPENKTITALNGEAIQKFSVNCGGTQTNFSWNDTNKIWFISEDKAFPLKQSMAKTLFTAAISLEADSVLTEPEADLSLYGLDAPQCTVTLTDIEGTETVLTVGAKNSFNSCYYLQKSGDDTIYLVNADFAAAAIHETLDFVEQEDKTLVDPAELTVQTADETVTLFAPEEPEKYSYALNAKWFVRQETQALLLDSDAVSELLDSVNEPKLSTCVAYKPTAAQMESFGLDAPKITVLLKDSDGTTVTLLFGDYADSDCYAMYQGSDRVWKIAAETVDTLRHLSVETLRPTAAFTFRWSKVKSIVLTDGEKTAKLALNVSSEGELLNCYLDDVIASNTRAQKLMDALDVMTVSERGGTVPADQEPMLTLEFALNSAAFPTLTATFTQYDSTTALVEFDGEIFRVPLEEANKLTAAFEALTASAASDD